MNEKIPLTREQKIANAHAAIMEIDKFHDGLIEVIKTKPTFHSLGFIMQHILIELRPFAEELNVEGQSYFNFMGCISDALLNTKTKDEEIICELVISHIKMVKAMQREGYQETLERIEKGEANVREPAEMEPAADT